MDDTEGRIYGISLGIVLDGVLVKVGKLDEVDDTVDDFESNVDTEAEEDEVRELVTVPRDNIALLLLIVGEPDVELVLDADAELELDGE